MTELLITNATLIPMDRPVVANGWLLVRDGLIEDLGGDDAPRIPGIPVRDVGGAFVAPGFVSAHSHLFTGAARGIAASLPLGPWTSRLCQATGHLDEENVFWHVLHGALDFLAHGVTTALDFADASERHETTPDGELSGVSTLRPLDYQMRQIDARSASGLRFVNAVFLDDAFGTDEQILQRFGSAVEYAAGKPGHLGSAVAGALQWSERADAAQLELAAMERFGVPNQAHVLESAVAVPEQRSKIAPYFQGDFPGLTLAHFLHPDESLLDAARGMSVAWQPVANARLGSGTVPIEALRRRGIPLGIGMDDQACNDTADPWENLRTAIFSVRLAMQDAAALTPVDALRMHTLGAAEVIGAAGAVGSLSPGKHADILVVDPREPDLGPLRDPVAGYVLACGQRHLREVYVGGVLVARDGLSLHPLRPEASARIRIGGLQ